MEQNAADGGQRRFILVQLPEVLDPAKKEQKVAADYCDKLGKPRTIAELTKERLRRAAKKVKAEHPEYEGDLGFRVFKLDTSNLKEWDPETADVSGSIFEAVNHVKGDRSELDLLYELLLKVGVDLAVPMEERTVEGKKVHAIAGGVLMVCMANKITKAEAEKLALGIAAWHTELAPARGKDSVIYFLDSAFADSEVKTNCALTLEQRGFKNVRSI